MADDISPTKLQTLDPAGSDVLLDGSQNTYPFFLEEFVGQDNKLGLIPNVPWGITDNTPLIEKIIGHRFKKAKKTDDSNYHFDRYARILMECIRLYNRALYRLRRGKVLYNHPEIFGRMPHLVNDAAELELPDPGTTTDAIRDQTYGKVEDAYIAALDNLKGLLAPKVSAPDPYTNSGTVYFKGMVHLIKVNDYVISVRIGGEAQDTPFPANDGEDAELPFSSSSYIFISSPFSSYTGGI